MDTKKRMGIWMDHSGAQLLEFSSEPKEMITIPLNTHIQGHNEGEKHNSEVKILHKEQNNVAAFYKKLVAIIRDFDEIVLFGPTNAKSEFYNFLRKDPYFEKMSITSKTTDKLSEEEKHLFVTNFFKRFEIKSS